MQIRRADSSDATVLAHIRQRAILELAPPILSVEHAIAWAAGSAPDRIPRALRDHVVWVAIDTEVIGWIDVHADHIAGLYVLPSAAGRGVGTTLLSTAETTIRDAGYTQARLDASPNARNFYLHRHYVPVGPQAPDGSIPVAKQLVASSGEASTS